MRAKTDRRQQILEILARELESHPGSRITTAALARAVGVSEAALYRHFSSKAKMFEALIDFAEESVFGLVNRIIEKDRDVEPRCEQILGRDHWCFLADQPGGADGLPAAL